MDVETIRSPAGLEEPFEGSDSGYVLVSETSDPQVVRMQDFSTGAAKYFGKYSLVASHTVNLATLEVNGGSFACTAADGDELRGTYYGRARLDDQPGVIGFEATAQVTGGKGRFAGATGRLIFVAIADLATGEFTQRVTGTVSTVPRSLASPAEHRRKPADARRVDDGEAPQLER